ncbi:MAG TPA: ROK family protein [Mycobacterium sp.]|nr:ROK family protein [Mycobacterium sp.]
MLVYFPIHKPVQWHGEPIIKPSIVLGLDFGGSKVAAAVADVDGRMLGSTVYDVRATDTAVQTFERSIHAVHSMLARCSSDRPLVAVGACTFGIPRDDGIDLAPNIDGWESLPFGTLLRSAFSGAEIRLATDVKAAAQAEVEGGALRGSDPGIYVNLGTGLAVALVVGGAVVSGRHGAAGEIGYNLRHPHATSQGKRLEDVVSGKALQETAAGLPGAPDVGQLFDMPPTDAEVARILDEFMTELCFHLVNLTIALDPERIVVGGGLTRAWPRLRPRLAEALASSVPYPPELAVAAHPYDAPLIGALALGRSAARQSHALRDVVSEGVSA